MADKLSREDLIAACKITINQFEDSAMAVEAVLTALEEKSEAEEFRTPKKAIYNEDETWYQCPTCRCIYEDVECPEDSLQYCPNCGQALDWTEVTG